MKNIRFDVLDSFRGLCALSVVLFHIRASSGLSELSFFRGSDILVDFFFVLSGFVLTHGYAFRGEIKFKSYFISRFFRIYPLHIVMLLVFIALETAKYIAYNRLGITFNSDPFTGVNSPSEILPSIFLIQAWFSWFERLSFNFPSWSISVEFYLYMIFFITMLAKGLARYSLWAIISLASFIMMVNNLDLLTISSMRGLSCFFGGALTYCVFRKSQISLGKTTATFIELSLLFIVALIVSGEFIYREIISSLLFMVTILFFAFEKGRVSTILKLPPFLFLGKLSYSIYMTHAAILFCILSFIIIVQKKAGIELSYMFKGERVLDFGSPLANSLLSILCLIIVIMISVLTYRIVEIGGIKIGKRLQE